MKPLTRSLEKNTLLCAQRLPALHHHPPTLPLPNKAQAPSSPGMGMPPSPSLAPVTRLEELKQTVLWKLSERKRLSQAFCLNSPHLFSQPWPPPLPPWAPPLPFLFSFFSPLLLIFKRAELTALALSKANPGSQPGASSCCWPSALPPTPTRGSLTAACTWLGAVNGEGERKGGRSSQEREPHALPLLSPPPPLPSRSNSPTQTQHPGTHYPASRHPLPSRIREACGRRDMRERVWERTKEDRQTFTERCAVLSGTLSDPIHLMLCVKLTFWHWREWFSCPYSKTYKMFPKWLKLS